tara:strand:+ start:2017 stop:2397 length:381 start_codon:yes stop_codon:yes gene_type:complete
MPKKSFLGSKIVAYIDANPLPNGYAPKFFAGKEFTSDVNYCRSVLLDLATEGKVLKRKSKACNNQMTYRFYSIKQYDGDYPSGMSNFISPSIFHNNNIEPNIEVLINSPEWQGFVITARIHWLGLT